MATEYRLSFTGAQIDEKLGAMITGAEADSKIARHDTDAIAHPDIRTAIEDKQDKITGTQGQFVCMGADGELVCDALPTASTHRRGTTYLVDDYTKTDTDKAVTPRALNEVYTIANAKQDAITGAAGQFVVIGEDGKPTVTTLTNVAEVGA